MLASPSSRARGHRGRTSTNVTTRGPVPGLQPSSGGTSTSTATSSSGMTKASSSTGTGSRESDELKERQAYVARREMTDAEKQTIERPDYGRAGNEVEVVTNSYLVKTSQKQVSIYQYEYTAQSYEMHCRPNVNEAFDFFQKFIAQLENVSQVNVWYDGRSKVYATQKIDDQNVTVKVDKRAYRGEEEFTVGFKLTRTFDPKTIWDCYQYMENPEANSRPNLEIHTALDCLLKHTPSITRVRVGSSFFPDMKQQRREPFAELGNGKCAVPGYSMGLKADQRMHIQIKAKNGAFYKAQPLIHTLNEMMFPGRDRGGNQRGGYRGGRDGGGGRGGNDSVTDRLFISEKTRKIIKPLIQGLMINIHYPDGSGGRTEKIKDVSPVPATELSFMLQDQRVNVADYYIRTRKIRLEHPYALCVNTRSKKNPTWYPIELCHVVANQPVKGALGEQEVSNMIRMCAKPATETMKICHEAFNQASGEIRNQLNVLGLDVEDRPARIPARLLETPTLRYAHNVSFQYRDGQWQPKEFYHVKKGLISWEGCYFGIPRGGEDREAMKFCEHLHNTGKKLGFNVNAPGYGNGHIEQCNPNDQMIEQYFFRKRAQYGKDQKQLQMVLCFMPRKDSKLYSTIKYIAERKFGILTQCITWKSVQRANDQLCGMVLMKINAKLGGMCSTIDLKLVAEQIFSVPTMIVGIAVNNTAKTQSQGASRACSVGMAFSTDSAASTYLMACGKSIDGKSVDDLHLMIGYALKMFYKVQERREESKPRHMIVYRTGISEAERGIISHIETREIKKGIKMVDDNWECKVTYITVDKNHSQRFASKDPHMQIGKSKNIRAGTVVDRVVCGANNRFDFYLASSQGIQGTSIPSYYVVCSDENRLNADTAQNLTYHLCYGYTRCCRTVSMPNAVMYAKLASERGRIWLNKALYDSFDAMSESSEEGHYTMTDTETALISKVLNVEELMDGQRNNLKKEFFFC